MNCLPASKECGATPNLKGGVWCSSYSGARYCGAGCVEPVFTVQDANAVLSARRAGNRSNFDQGVISWGVGYVPEFNQTDRPH